MYMPKRTNRSLLIDGLLNLMAKQSFSAVSLLSLNSNKLLNKILTSSSPINRQQELRAALRYMKYNQLLFENKDGSLSVTNKAKKRLDKTNFEQIIITKPKKWDKKWRLIMFDIPENNKTQRDAFSSKLRLMGFKTLKNGVFVYPFPCREAITNISSY